MRSPEEALDSTCFLLASFDQPIYPSSSGENPKKDLSQIVGSFASMPLCTSLFFTSTTILIFQRTQSTLCRAQWNDRNAARIRAIAARSVHWLDGRPRQFAALTSHSSGQATPQCSFTKPAVRCICGNGIKMKIGGSTLDPSRKPASLQKRAG